MLAAIPTCTFKKKGGGRGGGGDDTNENHQALIPLDMNHLLVIFAAFLTAVVLEAA